MAVLGAIEAPPTEYESITKLFEQTYEHEQKVTQLINELAETAFQKKTFPHSTSCNGMLPNSTRRRSCLSRFWIR
jgi:ferritin